MLNGIVWNRTDYLYKNQFGIKKLQRFICHEAQPTNQPTEYDIKWWGSSLGDLGNVE